MLRIKNLFVLFVLLFTMSAAMTAIAEEDCQAGQTPDDVCNASIHAYDAAIAAGMDETVAQATRAAAGANVKAGQSVADAVSAALIANGASNEVASAAANAITSGNTVESAVAAAVINSADTASGDAEEQISVAGSKTERVNGSHYIPGGSSGNALPVSPN